MSRKQKRDNVLRYLKKDPWNRLYRPTRVEAIHAAETAVCYLPLNKLEKTEKLFWVF